MLPRRHVYQLICCDHSCTLFVKLIFIQSPAFVVLPVPVTSHRNPKVSEHHVGSKKTRIDCIVGTRMSKLLVLMPTRRMLKVCAVSFHFT